MSLKSPLGRVLGLGSAKEGTDHFISQRLSAIGLALLGLWFIASMLSLDSLAYLEVIRFISDPLNGVLLSLLTLTVSYHSFLGVQVVVEDYVHATGLKVVTLIALRFVYIFIAVAGVYAILRIGFSV